MMTHLLFSLLLPLCPQDSKPAASLDLRGFWHGTLEVGKQKLRLFFRVEGGADGGLTGSLDSVDQGASRIPITRIQVHGAEVTMEIRSINGSYRADVTEDGRALDGTWAQNGVSLPLELRRAERDRELKRPQEPKPPFPYACEDVSYRNEGANIKLAGTLTLPKGKGPFPVVLMITGSGPQDRNEELLGHKPFLLLADVLTRAGIATLRVDDRGVGDSGGTGKTATSADFATDVLAGVRYLKSRPELDGRRIGLLGHSEGGLIAPMVARQCQDVAFVVLLSGPAVDGEHILYRQSDLMLRAAGGTDAQVAENVKKQKEAFAILRDTKDLEEARKKLQGAVGAAEAKSLATPWFQYFLSYDPAPALVALKIPALCLFGEKDLQVPVPENPDAMRALFKKSGNDKAVVEVVPGVNHLFQRCKTGAFAEYEQIEETMAPAVLERITGWVASVTR